MSTPSERIKNLVASGKVAPEEGARLLAAMGEASPKKSPSIVSTIINPFDRFGGGIAACAGLAISVASIVVTRFGVRFDGFFDIHIAPAPSILTSLGEQGIAWILPALCFFGYARLFTRHVRIVDFIGAVGLARLPLLLSAVPILLLVPSIGDASDPAKINTAAGSFIALAAIGLLCLAMHITLLYQGFKNASGLAGPKLVAGFIGLLIGVEIATFLVTKVLFK